jgi:hypothetical protein
MGKRREKEPFINRGDRILIKNGSCGGTWNVLAARWAKGDDAADDRIEVVLGRGTGMNLKTIFNAENMQHQSNWPREVLSRDINVQKPLKFRPK